MTIGGGTCKQVSLQPSCDFHERLDLMSSVRWMSVSDGRSRDVQIPGTVSLIIVLVLCSTGSFLLCDSMKCNTRYCQGLSVCLFVCLPVCQMRALWQTQINVCPHSHTTWKNIHSSFMRRRMVCIGVDPFYLKFWDKWPCWSENANYWLIALQP